MKKRYRYGLIIVIILLVLTTSIGSTYSLWTFHLEQTGSNNVSTPTCFDIDVDSAQDLYLTDVYPMSDAEGILTQPYIASITNNCSGAMPFKMIIEQTNNELSSNIRINLTGSYNLAASDLSNYYDANLGYVLISNTIPANSTKTFSLRMWVKEGNHGTSTTSDGTEITGTNINNKTFSGTVKFIAHTNF